MTTTASPLQTQQTQTQQTLSQDNVAYDTPEAVVAREIVRCSLPSRGNNSADQPRKRSASPLHPHPAPILYEIDRAMA